jgi:hypothetical protein
MPRPESRIWDGRKKAQKAQRGKPQPNRGVGIENWSLRICREKAKRAQGMNQTGRTPSPSHGCSLGPLGGNNFASITRAFTNASPDKAKCIIALGHISEHGLLRLLRNHEAKIFCNGQPWQPHQLVNTPASEWIDHYADQDRRLDHWLTPGRWWTISIQGSDMRLLPVYYPATVDKWDRDYTRTRKALKMLRDDHCCISFCLCLWHPIKSRMKLPNH